LRLRWQGLAKIRKKPIGLVQNFHTIGTIYGVFHIKGMGWLAFLCGKVMMNWTCKKHSGRSVWPSHCLHTG
jgi:hypothetical protein